VGLIELFTAALIAGISCINTALPAFAAVRSGERRFAALVAANAVLALLGGLWTWGQLPLSPPSWVVAPEPVLGLVLLVAALFLVSTLWPRSS